MDINQTRIQALIAAPAEALNVELKSWIDPTKPEGQSKIVRAALALRNRNGGELVIGFDDKTRLPDTKNVPADVRQAFHPDVIQGLISKYASDLFEVAVGYGERQGQLYPVIVIPSGVRTVVAAKADLRIPNSRTLIKHGDVYFRSLHANNTVSTSAARPEDWREIIEICLNNREADFGGFFRRQLAGTTPEAIRELLLPLENRSKILMAKPKTQTRISRLSSTVILTRRNFSVLLGRAVNVFAGSRTAIEIELHLGRVWSRL
jgi:hypothetical protein